MHSQKHSPAPSVVPPITDFFASAPIFLPSGGQIVRAVTPPGRQGLPLGGTQPFPSPTLKFWGEFQLLGVHCLNSLVAKGGTGISSSGMSAFLPGLLEAQGWASGGFEKEEGSLGPCSQRPSVLPAYPCLSLALLGCQCCGRFVHRVEMCCRGWCNKMLNGQ